MKIKDCSKHSSGILGASSFGDHRKSDSIPFVQREEAYLINFLIFECRPTSDCKTERDSLVFIEFPPFRDELSLNSNYLIGMKIFGRASRKLDMATSKM